MDLMNISTNETLITKAYEIGFHAHGETGETRGGQDNLPYFVHPICVAKAVAARITHLPPDTLAPYSHTQLVAAAVLHDVPEDCHPDWVDEIKLLDEKVLELTLMLRNGHLEVEGGDKLQREQKKALDFAKMVDPSRVHVVALIIKGEDRIDNLGTIGHWQTKRRLRYADESRTLAGVLLERFQAAPERALRDLGVAIVDDLYKMIEKVAVSC